MAFSCVVSDEINSAGEGIWFIRTAADSQPPTGNWEADQEDLVKQLLTVFLNSGFTVIGANSVNSWQIHSRFADQGTALKRWEHSDHDGSESKAAKTAQSPWQFLH